MNKRHALLAFLSLWLPAGAGFAQNDASSAPGPKYFHLDFVLKEVDGAKVINSRSYSMTVSTNSKSVLKSGNKVPLLTGGASSSLTYIDVGFNVDCSSVDEVQDALALRVSAESSSALGDLTLHSPAGAGQPSAAPIIRQARWDSNVIVPFRKPTVIFASDDPGTRHQMQLELTASRIK